MEVLCILNQKFMESIKDLFLKRWVTGTLAIYSGGLGLLHPLIAHGFTGDHDKLLTTPQFIMHSLSLFVFFFRYILMRQVIMPEGYASEIISGHKADLSQVA